MNFFLIDFILLTLFEIIRSLRESLYVDLYIDNQKKHFEISKIIKTLVQSSEK